MKYLPKQVMAMIVFLLMVPLEAPAYEEVEDLVEIFVNDGNYVAVVDGRSKFSESISSGEHVLWQGAKGEVGAFLTDRRLLAVSVTSGRWNRLYLKINEKQTTPDMLLAAHLLIMLTDERIVTFGTHTGGFFQTRLPIDEPVVAKAAEGRVAAVVTPTHAFGFSTYRRGVAERRLKQQEEVVSLNATYNKITLQTTGRVLSLDAKEAAWREFELK